MCAIAGVRILGQMKSIEFIHGRFKSNRLLTESSRNDHHLLIVSAHTTDSVHVAGEDLQMRSMDRAIVA